MAARYRKKPVEVSAVQWDGTNIAEVAELLQYDLTDDRLSTHTNPRAALYVTDDRAVVMTTVHGEQAVARVGDWVIPEPVPGRGYPVKPDIFAATYDVVDDETPNETAETRAFVIRQAEAFDALLDAGLKPWPVLAEPAGWSARCAACGHIVEGTRGSVTEAVERAQTCDCTSDTCEECP